MPYRGRTKDLTSKLVFFVSGQTQRSPLHAHLRWKIITMKEWKASQVLLYLSPVGRPASICPRHGLCRDTNKDLRPGPKVVRMVKG